MSLQNKQFFTSGSVTRVPETSFNNMHGRLEDLRTQDANKYLSKPPNTLGTYLPCQLMAWPLLIIFERYHLLLQDFSVVQSGLIFMGLLLSAIFLYHTRINRGYPPINFSISLLQCLSFSQQCNDDYNATLWMQMSTQLASFL